MVSGYFALEIYSSMVAAERRTERRSFAEAHSGTRSWLRPSPGGTLEGYSIPAGAETKIGGTFERDS